MIKKLLSVAFAFILGVMTVNAQIVKGDMNDDGKLTVADLANTASRILDDAPLEYVSPMVNPYATDNSLIVGTWYSRRIKSIKFGADGSFELNDSIRSDYSIQELADRGCRYEFMPNIGSVLVYDSLAEVVGAFDVLKVADSTLIMTLHGDKIYYTFSTSMPYIPPTPTVDSCVVKVELLPGGGMLESEFEEAKVMLKNVYTTVERDAATGKYVPAGIGNITLTRVKDSDNTIITRADTSSDRYIFAANMVPQPVLADTQMTMEVSGNMYLITLSQIATIPSFEKNIIYKYTMTLSKVGISNISLQVSSKTGGQTR